MMTTCEPGTSQHSGSAANHRDEGWPAPSQPVHPNNRQEVSRKLHQGGNHEGDVEVEVEIGDVPDGGVKHQADNHPENDTKNSDSPHIWVLEQISISVGWSEISFKI